MANCPANVRFGASDKNVQCDQPEGHKGAHRANGKEWPNPDDARADTREIATTLRGLADKLERLP